MGNEPWRVFCAIEIPETVRARVLRHIARLKEAVPDVKATWSQDANLHLTLKFLGEIPQSSVSDISTAASRAVVGLAPFSIRLEQTGAFPQQDQPRVLWIGVNDFSGKLNELQARLEDESASAGLVRDSRPFHPHLTVARLRQARHARTLAAVHRELEFEPADIAVAELLVIRSELSSEGSKYTIVSRHALGYPDKL
ncbi:MAG TPA: RNA 2',3'-cyclic phosphodiesterase [Pyrinomonadaceae bacterium]|jgi:2'-5' RNA ligase